jgi:plastocyanin
LRPRPVLGAILALGALGLAVWEIGSGHAASFTIVAGAQSGDASVQVNQFIPAVTTVNAGDTITWSFNSSAFHTVTFLSGAPRPPYLEPAEEGLAIHPLAAEPAGIATYDGAGIRSSGLLNRGNRYSLTFTQPGRFEYVCLVHPDMRAEIAVTALGQPADSPAGVEAQLAPQVTTALAGRALPLAVDFATVGSAVTVLGERAVTVSAGVGDGPVALMRFLPSNITVHVNDLVAWLNHDPSEPHTVTFLAGSPKPEVLLAEPRPNGGLRWLLNPRVLQLQGVGVFEGSQYTSSGLLRRDESGANAYTLRFTRPGVYQYGCLLHDVIGMVGTVTVVP